VQFVFARSLLFSSDPFICDSATRVTCVDDSNARTRQFSRIILCGWRCRAVAIPRSFSTRRTTRFIVRRGKWKHIIVFVAYLSPIFAWLCHANIQMIRISRILI